MKKTARNLLLNAFVLLAYVAQVNAQMDIDIPDEETPFVNAVICYGIYSKYYQMRLAYQANAEAKGMDAGLLGVSQARRGLRTWEKAILDRLADQTPQMQQDYPVTIHRASQALTDVFVEGSWDGVRESVYDQCDSYVSGERQPGIDPLDAGVTIPLLDSARDMTPDQMTQCLTVAEYERVLNGPQGVMKTNAFRQRYADWMAEGGFSSDEVSARTEEFGRNAFEDSLKKTVLASMEGQSENPLDNAIAYCMPLLKQ